MFEELGLDIEVLREIFRGAPLPVPGLDQCSAYWRLGTCPARDDDGWKKLAALSGKIIRFVHCHGSPEGAVRAVYHPDGNVEIPAA